MDKFLKILDTAIELKASDIHLIDNKSPVYRIEKKLLINEKIDKLTKYDLEGLMEYLVDNSLELVELFETTKKLDLSYEYKDKRFRINASMSSGVPTFSIRIIENDTINIKKYRLEEMVKTIKMFNSGLVLITGKVNSGKTTTLNAYVQSVNNERSKKIVMLEEPIEYRHKSKKSIIVQKEVGKAGDIPSYYDGVINLLREDADVAIIGEIRDRQTMDAVLDLAESGTLVIGTLHTRSAGETLDRILGLYSPVEQKSIKYVLSTVLKAIVSQKLVKDKDEHLLMVPEVMINNSVIAALIRQENFSISEIQDAINIKSERGTISFEKSFARLYREGMITLESIRNNVEDNQYEYIMKLIGGDI